MVISENFLCCLLKSSSIFESSNSIAIIDELASFPNQYTLGIPTTLKITRDCTYWEAIVRICSTYLVLFVSLLKISLLKWYWSTVNFLNETVKRIKIGYRRRTDLPFTIISL